MKRREFLLLTSGLFVPACGGRPGRITSSHDGVLGGAIVRTLGFGVYDYDATGADIAALVETAITELHAAVQQNPLVELGVLEVQPGTYMAARSIVWPTGVHDVSVVGNGVTGRPVFDSAPVSGHANTFEARADTTVRLADLEIRSSGIGGAGIWSRQITAGIELIGCAFDTQFSAVYVDNYAGPNTNGEPLGNIVIRECEFGPAVRALHDWQNLFQHKVVIVGRSPGGTSLEITNNTFTYSTEQYGHYVVELYVTGEDMSSALGTSDTALNGGTISNNTIVGGSRECMIVGDHRYLTIHDNDLTNSKRVGLYVVRGHRTTVRGNRIVGAVERGLRIDYLSECEWTNNQALGVGTARTPFWESGGATVIDGTNNTVTDNYVEAVNGYGLRVSPEVYTTCPSGNDIRRNTFVSPLGLFAEPCLSAPVTAQLLADNSFPIV